MTHGQQSRHRCFFRSLQMLILEVFVARPLFPPLASFIDALSSIDDEIPNLYRCHRVNTLLSPTLLPSSSFMPITVQAFHFHVLYFLQTCPWISQ